MKHLLAFTFASMVAVPLLVNVSMAATEATPSSMKPASSLKEFDRLVELISRIGDDDTLSANISPILGATGTPPVKGPEIIVKKKDGEERREFSIVYSNSDNPPVDKKVPLFIYIRHENVSGHDIESRWFKINLEGGLEKVQVILGKVDDNGKSIRGSGAAHENDVTSSKIKKEFRSELDYWTKVWMKKISPQ